MIAYIPLLQLEHNGCLSAWRKLGLQNALSERTLKLKVFGIRNSVKVVEKVEL